MSVKAGQKVHATLAGTVSTLKTRSGVESYITSQLENNYRLHVVGLAVNDADLLSWASVRGLLTFAVPYTATIDVIPNVDFASVDDIQSIIASVFSSACGSYPVVTIPTVSGVPTGQPKATGLDPQKFPLGKWALISFVVIAAAGLVYAKVAQRKLW